MTPPVVGFSIFRRSRHGRLAKRFTIEIRMPDGTTRQRAGFSDKGATQQFATKLVREIERREMGLVDPFADYRRAPIGEHAAAFLQSMAAGTLGGRRRSSPKPEWIGRAKKRLGFMLRAMGAARVEMLKLDEAERVLLQQVRQGWSDKTRDDHAALLRQFGEWLVDEKRTPDNPFRRLRPTRSAASKTFGRHALTVGELEQLVEAAEVRPLQAGVRANPWMSERRRGQLQVDGAQRAVLYQVAAYTGLRRGEVLALVWGDVRFGSEPAIAVRAGTTKNRRAARIELPRWLAELLEQLRKGRAGADGALPAGAATVFDLSYRHVTERLRLDALFARIGTEQVVRGKKRVVSEDGRVIDFHALRGTLATLAGEVGVPPQVMRDLLRHSDVRLTIDVYAQVRNGAMRAAVESLPAVGQRRSQ